MLDHVSIAVNDFAAATRFYDAIFAALGVACVWREPDAIGYGIRNSADDDRYSYLTIRHAPGADPGAFDSAAHHWCFRAPSRAAVGRFYADGIAAGGQCDGAPGVRPHYHMNYYAAFLRDPDGNRIEAVCHRSA